MQLRVVSRLATPCVALALATLLGACAAGVRPAPATTPRAAAPPVVAAALPPGDPPVEWDGRTQMVEDPEPARRDGDAVVKPLGPVGRDRAELRRRVTVLVRQTVDYGIKIKPDYKARPGDVPVIVETLMRGDPATVVYDHRFHPSIVARYLIDFGANLVKVTQPGQRLSARGATVARRVFDIYFAPLPVSPLPATYSAYCALKKPWDKGFKLIGREY
jgi:hypothetical protein